MKVRSSLYWTILFLHVCLTGRRGDCACCGGSSIVVSAAAVAAPARNRHQQHRSTAMVEQPYEGEMRKGPIQVFVNTIMEARRHLVAAAVARSISILGMYPVDTIKTRIQTEQVNAMRLTGLFSGVSGSLIGQVPYGVITFGSYEMYKKALLERFPNVKPLYLYAIAAVAGDLTGSGWICPSEVVKQQVQAGMYKSASGALRGILGTKGIMGLYQGYFGAVARDVPFRVAQLTSFEFTKDLYLRFKRRRLQNYAEEGGFDASTDEVVLTPLESAFCGAVSGTFSSAITTPLDRIKTLLMTNSAAYGGSVTSCAAKIFKQEGLSGFMTGLVPRVTYIAPSVVIFFVVYEQMQQKLNSWQ